MDEIIDELFEDTNIASTPEIARAFSLSERDARGWAEELGVGKIGASYVWTRDDAEALVAELDEEDVEDDEDDTEDGVDEDEHGDDA
jgi:hypothetical protein